MRQPIFSLADRQHGLVLFFALIALVAMSLAAVALIRSVDTNTMISGNLAFRQAATTTADTGVEAAINTLTVRNNSSTADPFVDPSHPLNVTNAAIGYYSNIDLRLDLFADATWVDGVSSPETTDPNTGNRVRFIIQRMCRNANAVVSRSNCLFSGEPADTGGKSIFGYGGGEIKSEESPPQYRVTVRAAGPRNTFSFVQAMIF